MSERKCRQCLLWELIQGQDLYEVMKAYRVEVPPEDRTPEEDYEARLTICRRCRELQGATCMQCGCYVEFRAAKRYMYCPMGRWQRLSSPSGGG